MTNPSPLLPSTVSAPSSPRQASVSLSKIPRRRPSTQLQHPLPVDPSSASSSPTKSALHHHHHSSSAVAHARRPSVSKAHFASPPASVFPDEQLDDGQQHESATSPIQERRRFSTTARTPSRTRGGRDERDREEREAIEFETTQLRRAPSLSIHIPSSSASPSPHHPPSSSIRHSRRPSHPTATASPHHPRASTSTSTSAAASPSTPSSHYGAAFAPHSRRTSLSGRTPRGTPSHHSHHHPHHSPHPSSTMPTPSHSQTLPAHLPPRPAMTERTWSGTTTQTYTSFDLQHPRTPKDERSEGEGGLYCGSGAGGGGGGRGWLARWLERRISEREEEGGEGRDEEEEVGERSALLGANGTGSRRSSGGEGAPLGPVGNGESGWKYARAEIACYARHILPPVFVFVFIVLLLALFFYREAVGKVTEDAADGKRRCLTSSEPTPLYFTDEIDAALDFRNVSIVANYIKERTCEAQFIIISLRNNMFELSARLVGIYKVDNHTRSIAIDNTELADIPNVEDDAPEVAVDERAAVESADEDEEQEVGEEEEEAAEEEQEEEEDDSWTVFLHHRHTPSRPPLFRSRTALSPSPVFLFVFRLPTRF